MRSKFYNSVLDKTFVKGKFSGPLFYVKQFGCEPRLGQVGKFR